MPTLPGGSSNDVIHVMDVLLNDSDPDGDTITLSAVITQPTDGNVTIVDQKLHWSNPPSVEGTNTCRYEITDGSGATAEADCTMIIQAGAGTPPTDIQLSENSIFETQGDGTVIGTLTAVDADQVSHTFTVETNTANFKIVVVGSTSELQAKTTMTAGTELVTIKAVDADGNEYSEELSIIVKAGSPFVIVLPVPSVYSDGGETHIYTDTATGYDIELTQGGTSTSNPYIYFNLATDIPSGSTVKVSYDTEILSGSDAMLGSDDLLGLDRPWVVGYTEYTHTLTADQGALGMLLDSTQGIGKVRVTNLSLLVL